MNSLVSQIQPRTCETPRFMFVEGFRFKRYCLYIYVPKTTKMFTLSVYEQSDNKGNTSQTSFTVRSPEGIKIQLDKPIKNDWAPYKFEVNGSWGVWQLRIEAGPPPCRSEFLVKTTGEVDLYAKPEPCVSYRGALSFTGPKTNGELSHIFTMQVTELNRLRINFLLPISTVTLDHSDMISVDGPSGIDYQHSWVGISEDRLAIGDFYRLEYMEITGTNLEGLWQLNLSNIEGVYHLGIEQQIRLFFNATPLMPQPIKTEFHTSLRDGSPVAARIELNSPRIKREGYAGFPGKECPYTVFTNMSGEGNAFLIPNLDYTAKISRGFGFEVNDATILDSMMHLDLIMSVKLKARQGWYGGDCHTHSVYSDGSFTPAQVIEGAKAEGLDWIVLSDHGQGPHVPAVLRAHEEALATYDSPRFLVIPGEEFSAESFHANIFNGIIGGQEGDSLQSIIDTVIDLSTEDVPLTIAWNHPFGHGKDLIDEDLVGLPLIELWNTEQGNEEKFTTELWWSWLQQGKRVFAETGTDSHHRIDNPYGHRRTYVYLGDKDLTAQNVVKTLKLGRSFLSRGALIYFTANGVMPGATTESNSLEVQVQVDSAVPMARIEIIGNSQVVHSFEAKNALQFSGRAKIYNASGWYLAQVFSAEDDILPIALTNPIFCIDKDR